MCIHTDVITIVFCAQDTSWVGIFLDGRWCWRIGALELPIASRPTKTMGRDGVNSIAAGIIHVTDEADVCLRRLFGCDTVALYAVGPSLRAIAGFGY